MPRVAITAGAARTAASADRTGRGPTRPMAGGHRGTHRTRHGRPLADRHQSLSTPLVEEADLVAPSTGSQHGTG